MAEAQDLKIMVSWQLARRFLDDDWTDELVEELTSIMADAAMRQGLPAFQRAHLEALLGKTLPFLPGPHDRRTVDQGPCLRDQVLAALDVSEPGSSSASSATTLEAG